MHRRLPAMVAIILSFGLSAPAAACTLPSILYFAPGSDGITARSEQVLTVLVSWIQRRGDGLKEIRVAGHSDRTGSRRARMAISLARAEAVRDRLISYGVFAGAITIHAMADARLAVDTPDGTPETDNRRVEIGFTLTEGGEEALRLSNAARVGDVATCG